MSITTSSASTRSPVTFAQSMSQQVALTENGALSLSTTQPVGMDESIHGRMAFFFKTVRSLMSDTAQLYKYLSLANSENVRDTLILVFHLRNCRSKNGGKGERSLFRACVEWYKMNGKEDLLRRNLASVVEFGRWDDVLVCPGGHDYMARQLLADAAIVRDWKEKVESKVEIKEEISAPNPIISLASKWAPSACSKNEKSKDKHVAMVKAINAVLKETGQTLLGRHAIREKEYRQTLSMLRGHLVLVERLMCANQWSRIDFNHVPSNAMHLYGKSVINGAKKSHKKRSRSFSNHGRSLPGAFLRHCPETFPAWRESLKYGKTEDGKVVKVNASQLFPHELVAQYLAHNKQEDALVEAQWKVLEDDVRKKGSLRGCLFVADVSGSMTVEASPGSSVRCLDVSVALSLLGSRASDGVFKDLVMTFSESPTFFEIKEESMFGAVTSMANMDWGGNTNLEAVFDLILQRGLMYHVPESEMPRAVVIVSDMEFDSACRMSTNFESIRQKYDSARYKCPTLVFWNVRTSSDVHQFPVSADESGTILLSGYSSSMMKELMEDDITKIDPWKVVRKIIDSPMYANIVV